VGAADVGNFPVRSTTPRSIGVRATNLDLTSSRY